MSLIHDNTLVITSSAVNMSPLSCPLSQILLLVLAYRDADLSLHLTPAL